MKTLGSAPTYTSGRRLTDPFTMPRRRIDTPPAPAAPADGPVTLQRVAQAAGVSASTVSRILNGTAVVSQEKKQAVDEAIALLGFVPNPVARGLAGGRTLSVGVVTQSIDSPFYGVALRGIEVELDRAGYSPLFVSGHWNASEEARCIDILRSRRVDGIIVLTGRLSDAALKQTARSLPVVVTGRKLRAPNLYSLDFDNFEGARLATEHLVALGHRRIAFIAGNSEHPDAHERLRGYRSGLEAAGIRFDPDLVAAGLGVTAALARLHGEGLLFNDFKPRNVGIATTTSSGAAGGEVVKLIDFGHARTLADTRARHCLCGTVDYAPPEAWGPGRMAAASDVWAWGRSWHLLASGHYFERIENFRQLLQAGRSPLPPVARVSRSPLPPGLATLIDAALDPNPERRPADGQELQERLQEIAREEWGDALGSLSRFALPLQGDGVPALTLRSADGGSWPLGKTAPHGLHEQAHGQAVRIGFQKWGAK